MPYLSRMNTVKKLRLGNFRRIPLDVFLMKQLTDLYLHECYMLQQQTFNGFSNVTTLTLNEVFIYKKTLIHVLSKCPLLKTLNLLQEPQHIQSDDNSSLIELFECLPLIENLTICLWAFECFDELPRELPTSLQNLKYMCLYHVFLGGDNEYTMPILAFFSRSSPNLEKIKLRISTLKKIIIYPDLLEPDSHADEESGVSEDYSDIQLKNLNELEIENLGSKKVELQFVKLMLLMSPVLKTLKIFLNEEVAEDKELEVLNILLSCPHTYV
ncbi:F-box/FBD/LRR-repeat protein At1g13570-like [Rutidosis leptorrhynchoides]|uniref:F-box/FBD/LRR-repeat protein At1g13570-like n=1 Tax=Rutidosis leptorrhynchoides TaxID=125765 RepID=UPI003A98F74F